MDRKALNKGPLVIVDAFSKTKEIQTAQTHPSFTSLSNSDRYSTETHQIASIFVNMKENIISPEWDERKYEG